MNQAVGNQDPLMEQINECITLFQISRQLCLERANPLLRAHPRNLRIVQIVAACYSLTQEYARANQLYRVCLQIAPDSIAFYNNMAFNCIGLAEYVQPVTYLNDIKQKWMHPTIYRNLSVAYERGRVNDANLIGEALQKMHESEHFYPDYDQPIKRGMIHTFLLNERQNFLQQRIRGFRGQIFEIVIALQNVLNVGFDYNTINNILQQVEPRMNYRLQQENQSGFIIEKKLKASMRAINAFKGIIIPIYDLQYQHQLRRFITMSITILNEHIFTIDIPEDTDFNIFDHQIIRPIITQLNEISRQMTIFITRLNRDQQIIQNEIRRDDRYTRPPVNRAQYQLKTKIQDVQRILQDQEEVIQSLKVQRNSQANPLLLLVRFKRLHYDVYHVYVNPVRIRVQLQLIPNSLAQRLNEIPNQQSRNYFTKYLYALRILMKFYHFYGSNDFVYRLNRADSQLSLNNYIQLITPILNEISEQFNNIGWICNQIHFAILKYLNQTGQAQRSLLQNLRAILQNQQNQAERLLLDILTQQNRQYFTILLSTEFIRVKSSVNQHEYFLWNLNHYHNFHPEQEYTRHFTNQDDWLISNIALLLITAAQNRIQDQNRQSLVKALTQCYYESRSKQSYRNVVIRKFYDANHEIPPMERMTNILERLARKILP